MYIAINEFTNLETKKQSIKIIFVQRNNLIIYSESKKKTIFFKKSLTEQNVSLSPAYNVL